MRGLIKSRSTGGGGADNICVFVCVGICVFAGGLCGRWAQRALQPVSWSFYESSRCHSIGVQFQKPPTGGSLGFDVSAAVENLRCALCDPGGASAAQSFI